MYNLKKDFTFLILLPERFLPVQSAGLEKISLQKSKFKFSSVFLKQHIRASVGVSNDARIL